MSVEPFPACAEWQPDAEAPVCNGCRSSFNMLRRRHHCRKCGKVFCFSCAPRASVRMCGTCLDRRNKVQSEGKFKEADAALARLSLHGERQDALMEKDERYLAWGCIPRHRRHRTAATSSPTVPPELAPIALFGAATPVLIQRICKSGTQQRKIAFQSVDWTQAANGMQNVRVSSARIEEGDLVQDFAERRAACFSQEGTPDNLREHCDQLEAELVHERERVKSLAQEVERARAADLEWQRQRVAIEAERAEEREELKLMSEELQRERERCSALQAGMQARLDAALQEIDDLRSATAEQQQQQAAHMCGPAGGTRAAAAETVGHACSVTRTVKEEQEGREEFLYCDSFQEPDFSASAKSPKTPPRSPIWGSGPSPDHQRQDRCRQPDSTPWQSEYERNKMEEAVTEAAVKRRSSDWVGWALKVSHGRHGGSKHGGNKRREVAQARGVKKADVTGT